MSLFSFCLFLSQFLFCLFYIILTFTFILLLPGNTCTEIQVCVTAHLTNYNRIIQKLCLEEFSVQIYKVRIHVS